LLPILFFLSKSCNWKERTKWVCFLLAVLSIIAEVANYILVKDHQNTIIVSNLYILGDTIMVFYLFTWQFNSQERLKRLVITLLIVFLGTWCLHNFFRETIFIFDSLSNGIETLSIILLSLIFFYHQIIKPQNFFIYTSPAFWIISGILIYKSGTFFLFLYFDTLEQTQKNQFKNLYIINSAFLFIRNILFTMGLSLHKKSTHRKNLNPYI
jgi:hypothetical protein